jgi:large subunit ribosomal protein L22
MANAAQDESVNLNRLIVLDARGDEGPMLNNRLRWRPGPQGRAMPFAKKTSHLTVVVAEPLDDDAAGTPAEDAGSQES